MLNRLADDLWDLNAPLTIVGMALGHRMTVVRLPAAGAVPAARPLWIHSPVAYSPALADELAQLGTVEHVVAPNCVHDTYLESWFSVYPAARFHGAIGFRHVRPDLKFTDTLGKSAAAAWADDLDQLVVGGMPRVNEVVFRHRKSRTLILTDLAFNLGPDVPLLSRVLLRINGCYGRFAVSRLLRSTIKDRAAVREAVDRILAWDFDRIVLSHGRNVEANAKETLREAFLFL